MRNRKVREEIGRLDKSLKTVKEVLREKESAVKWDRRYINNLPNAAFAVVERGYKEGGNKNLRHLPHHNSNVKSATENSSVDLPHY